MPIFSVTAQKKGQLQNRMDGLGIKEEDLHEKFVKGSGSGGQKVNKTSSCVYLIHKPTGIEVKCQRERSQAMNRFLARRELCDRLEEKVKGERSARRQKMEKIRRQKRRRTRRQKEKMLELKHKQSGKKLLRRRVDADD